MNTIPKRWGHESIYIGINGGVAVGGRSPHEWMEDASDWKDLDATRLSVSTRGAGLSFLNGHIDAVQRFRQAVDESGIAGA